VTHFSIKIKRLLSITLLIVFCSSPQSLFAQAVSPEKLAAVLTIINNYLLDIDTGVDLDFDITQNNKYQVSQDFEIVFDSQPEDVEFCFVVESAQSLAALNLSLTLNENNLAPPSLGENCYTIPVGQQLAENTALFVVGGSGSASLSFIGISSAAPSQHQLGSLTRSGWNERAVRKVLKIFAFGGHATDQQILQWSYMRPVDAIEEMLTFEERNLKLSPISGEKYTEHTQGLVSVDVPKTINDVEVLITETVRPATLYGWQQYLRARNTNYPVPAVVPREGDDPYYPRNQYGIDGYNFDDGYNRMITVRGLNPFRQRIGFWETNYHLATNLDADVQRRQMAIYYDEIMAAHEAGLPYKDVMGIAAKSAAVAMQYGHRNNRWDSNNNVCNCNEDFAREIHQLYYGIFGTHDPLPNDGVSGPDYHENVTIPNTAKMLTDMNVPYLNEDANAGFTGWDIKVTFETDDHHTAPLTILGQNVSGANASAKIDALMPLSMMHPEAQQNLPIMIISVLADDNLSESDKAQLRTSWASMGVNVVLLDFLRAYAISDIFHSPTQLKYLTTHERALYMANKHNQDNIEAYFGGGYYNGARLGRSVGGIISDEAAGDFFRPLHNVFGGQNSAEASDSALIFEKNYNRLTDNENELRDAVGCKECDNGQPWEKPWHEVLPKRQDGEYYVEDIAPWLWKHVVGHLDNYTELERAHLYALLGATRIEVGDDDDGDNGVDFNFVMCVIEDYQLRNNTNATPIIDIFTNDQNGSTWDDYCRENDDRDGVPNGVDETYEPHELAALNAGLTGTQIANDPEIQNILSQLGQVKIRLTATEGYEWIETPPDSGNYELLNDGGFRLRTNARIAVSNALGFIYATPFVFAEGE